MSAKMLAMALLFFRISVSQDTMSHHDHTERGMKAEGNI